jgi:hypothetical protein
MSICDCERSHNGLGVVGRECDCEPAPASVEELVKLVETTGTLEGLRVRLATALRALSAEAARERPTDDALWDKTLKERDDYHDMADKLAQAIGAYFNVEIGEHSNLNCPWLQALEAIESAEPAEAARERQAREAVDEHLRQSMASRGLALEGDFFPPWMSMVVSFDHERNAKEAAESEASTLRSKLDEAREDALKYKAAWIAAAEDRDALLARTTTPIDGTPDPA